MQKQATRNTEQVEAAMAVEEKKEAWANIDSAQDEKEVERVKQSANWGLHPDLATKAFVAMPRAVKNFGREEIVMAFKVHQNWVKNIGSLPESMQSYLRVCGLDKEYKGKIGRLNSRKKGKENREYLGMSVQLDDEVMNAPFELDEFKILAKLGYIKRAEPKQTEMP